MGKIILISILLMTLSSLGFSQMADTLIAKRMVLFLKANQFDSITKFVDPSLTDKLTPDMMEHAWNGLIKQTGNFKDIVHARSQRKDTMSVMFITCEFEKATMDVKISMNKDQKVVGVFFSRASFDSKYMIPSYVVMDSIKEIPLTIPGNKHGLPATVTIPANREIFPIVILVHGSGPNDRDETNEGSKLFKDLALGLATKGIATIRYEKRTRAYPEDFDRSITVREETMDDAEEIARYVKKLNGVDTNNIFLAGHSLGGYLAPRIASETPSLKGIILLAGNARPMEDLLLEQISYLYSLEKGNHKKEINSLRQKVDFVKGGTFSLSTPDSLFPLPLPPAYWLDLQHYDPPKTAQALTCRILVLQGERDYQVKMTDFNLWKKALETNKNASFRSYPKLNHPMMEGKGKSTPKEYFNQTNAPAYLINDVAEWILH